MSTAKKIFFFGVLSPSSAFLYLCIMKKAIISWLESPSKDYFEGVRLLQAAGARPRLVAMFNNRSPRFALDELIYNLRKMAASAPSSTSSSTSILHQDEPPKIIQVATPAKSSIPDSHPAAIAKRLVQDLHTEISRLHNELFDIGVANDDRSMERRRSIIEERKPLIKRYNQIYEAKEAFFSGELNDSQLLDIINYKEESTITTVQNIQSLTDVDILRRIKAAKSCINRCNNQLRFQKDAAVVNGQQMPENPLPDCPKREKIKTRLAARTSELVQLVAEAEKRGINGDS